MSSTQSILWLEVNMAAAVTEESFEDCWFSEEHVMSESGIVMGKEVLCELILNKIRKIQKSKARADSNAVCKGLSKDHGLDEKAVLMCLDYMFLTKTIDKKFHRGKESLRIKEKDSDIGDKDKFLEEFSDAERLERNGDNEENDENTGKKLGKARKISNDMEKILELRSELTNRAEQQEKLMADEDNTEDGSSSLSNYSESDSDATELTANGEISGNLCRLDEIERKLARIESRLNEKDNEKDSERRKIDRVRDEQYVQLMVKTERLEVENKTLKDENYGLRTKILDLQQMLVKPGSKICVEKPSLQSSQDQASTGNPKSKFFGDSRGKTPFYNK